MLLCNVLLNLGNFNYTVGGVTELRIERLDINFSDYCNQFTTQLPQK